MDKCSKCGKWFGKKFILIDSNNNKYYDDCAEKHIYKRKKEYKQK